MLWFAIGLIFAGATLAGVAMVAISLDPFVGRALFGAAIPVAFLGVMLAVNHNIMGDVD